MKKVIVFGGGTGLSCLLSGLKLFPVEVTTVITVSDNGSSTGVLKQEFDIPAVGDVGKVLLSMANVDDDLVKLLRYRFHREGSSLDNHPVRNILLTALIDLKGNLTEATRYMCGMLNIKGEVLPLTEEKVELVGKSANGKREFYGEGRRWFDIKRLAVRRHGYVSFLDYERGDFPSWIKTVYPGNDSYEIDGWNDRHQLMYWPIPQVERDKSYGALTQNPGYEGYNN